MFETMRKVFGPVAVGVIIGAIALVFVFYGVYNPRTAGRFGGGSSNAASVNGAAISWQEFEQNYQNRIDFYQNMFKGKVDLNLLNQLGLKRQVLQDLISQKLILQEAKKLGFTTSDDELREKIQQMTYFKDKQTGKFNPILYQRVLEANRKTPSEFEELVRDDLVRSHFMDFIQSSAKVSEKELEQEFLINEDRRQVDYVVINQAPPLKQTDPKAPRLDDKTKSNEPSPTELLKINKVLADEVLSKIKTLQPVAFKNFLKSKKLELKISEKFNHTQESLNNMGLVPDLVEDAFKDPSPLQKEPKLYQTHDHYVLAMHLQSFAPKMEDFQKSKAELSKSTLAKKQQELFQQWMNEVRTHSKIVMSKNIQEVQRTDEE